MNQPNGERVTSQEVMQSKDEALAEVQSVNEYLRVKRPAYLAIVALAQEVRTGGNELSVPLTTKGRIAGRSGVREVFDGEGNRYISDTPALWNGNDRWCRSSGGKVLRVASGMVTSDWI